MSYQVGSTIVSSKDAINPKVVGSTLLYTVPEGNSLVLINGMVRCTDATAILTGPTAGVGTTTSISDIYASTIIGTLNAKNKVFAFSNFGMSVVIPAGGKVYFNITGASTGTSQVLAVDMIGYLISTGV